MKSKFKVFKDIVDVIKISNKSDRLFFPLTVLKSLVTASFPFVGLIYSALILDGFIDELDKATIMSYVYQMIVISAILLITRTILNFFCEQKTNLISLRLKSEISRKTLYLDFEQLESQEIKDKISRANQKITSLDKKLITNKNIKMIKELNIIAKKRGQSLSQMAIAWALNNKSVTSALIGVRNVKQLRENVDSLNKLNFTKNELSLINKKAKDGGINLWLASSSH